LYRTAPVAALLCLVLGLSACGGGSDTTAGAGTGEQTVKARGELPAPDPEAAASPTRGSTSPKGAAGAEACDARIGDFVDRMNDLRQSLLAGLSYDEYVVRVRAVRDAYEAVPVDKLGASCVSGPAAKAEAAFNQYLRAANTWGECAATAGCAASEVEGKLQKRWKQASTKLDAAEKPS
jgi:hypothetical protein